MLNSDSILVPPLTATCLSDRDARSIVDKLPKVATAWRATGHLAKFYRADNCAACGAATAASALSADGYCSGCASRPRRAMVLRETRKRGTALRDEVRLLLLVTCCVCSWFCGAWYGMTGRCSAFSECATIAAPAGSYPAGRGLRISSGAPYATIRGVRFGTCDCSMRIVVSPLRRVRTGAGGSRGGVMARCDGGGLGFWCVGSAAATR